MKTKRMKFSVKHASAFAASLTVAQLRQAVTAYARGVPFEKTQLALLETRAEHLPERFALLVRFLNKPRTIHEISDKITVSKDTAWTYLSRMRALGVRISTVRKYGKTVYFVEKQ